MISRPFRNRSLCLLLGSLVIGVLAMVLAAAAADGRPASTAFQWRDMGSWSFGWRRVAYCSEQNASLRGWKAEFGPLAVSRLWWSGTNAVDGFRR